MSKKPQGPLHEENSPAEAPNAPEQPEDGEAWTDEDEGERDRFMEETDGYPPSHEEEHHE